MVWNVVHVMRYVMRYIVVCNAVYYMVCNAVYIVVCNAICKAVYCGMQYGILGILWHVMRYVMRYAMRYIMVCNEVYCGMYIIEV